MTSISITKARNNIYQMLASVNEENEPITIINNKGKNGVLISEDDWRTIQETLYLNSTPAVEEKILDAARTPLSECVSEKEVEW